MVTYQLPAPLSVRNMSDDEFLHFCASNKGMKIERNADYTINIMAPLALDTDDIESTIQTLLKVWSWESGAGIVYNSQSGFKMPDGSILSPDVAMLTQMQFDSLEKAERKRIPAVVPGFIAEVRSEAQSLIEQQDKLQRWMNYGVSLGWLVDPIDRQVFIYRQSETQPEHIPAFDRTIIGTGVLESFTLDLTRLAHILDR
jgi:Uma2 family endonuclease